MPLYRKAACVSKEVKRRTKVVEAFCGEEALEKLVYLVLSKRNAAGSASVARICRGSDGKQPQCLGTKRGARVVKLSKLAELVTLTYFWLLEGLGK